MTRKDEKDTERPHYYSQFWLDVAAGRREIGSSKTDDASEADEPGGMFGDEEQLEIIPAVEHCRNLGIDVSGPYSPDTIFLRCSKGEFDAVIALYHDQATIPVKSIAFGSAVNVTLGLPLIRTSVDHGNAYDIAGKGIVVFTACSHAGVVNVLRHAREMFPSHPLHAVAGGFHLSARNEAISPSPPASARSPPSTTASASRGSTPTSSTTTPSAASP